MRQENSDGGWQIPVVAVVEASLAAELDVTRNNTTPVFNWEYEGD